MFLASSQRSVLRSLLAGEIREVRSKEPLLAFPIVRGGRGLGQGREMDAGPVPEGPVAALSGLSGRPWNANDPSSWTSTPPDQRTFRTRGYCRQWRFGDLGHPRPEHDRPRHLVPGRDGRVESPEALRPERRPDQAAAVRIDPRPPESGWTKISSVNAVSRAEDETAVEVGHLERSDERPMEIDGPFPAPTEEAHMAGCEAPLEKRPRIIALPQGHDGRDVLRSRRRISQATEGAGTGDDPFEVLEEHGVFPVERPGKGARSELPAPR